MMSALIVCTPSNQAPDLAADLETVGVTVVAQTSSDDLVHAAISTASDLIICFESHLSDALFSGISVLRDASPRPVVVFTTDPDAEKIERATRSGIHAYVVNGYGLNRLRSIIHLAQARFRHEETLRNELTSVTKRFEERKLVDRAKGILMRAHRIPEDQAFRALRTAAMHSKLRVGQVSQHIIEAANYAQAVNRAGQLRMFSQRIVTHYALFCAETQPSESGKVLRSSENSIDESLALLERALSRATFGDLIEGVVQPWRGLKEFLKERPARERLPEVDRLAEELLRQSEQLVTNLEIAGLSKSLHVINVAGRQRMLSQRMAKLALLGALLPATEATERALQDTQEMFSQAMAYLSAIPLATTDIKERLNAAQRLSRAFAEALTKANTPSGRREIAELSEALVGLFDQLTEQYELGMEMLMK
jgi:AmiR/NasT family two-component response regulator